MLYVHKVFLYDCTYTYYYSSLQNYTDFSRNIAENSAENAENVPEIF